MLAAHHLGVEAGVEPGADADAAVGRLKPDPVAGGDAARARGVGMQLDLWVGHPAAQARQVVCWLSQNHSDFAHVRISGKRSASSGRDLGLVRGSSNSGSGG